MVKDEPIRVLFATDCAFWHNRTGAQQRILTLLKHLVQQAYVVETLYCAKLSNVDEELVAQHDLRVEEVFDNVPPTDAWSKLAWHVRGTIHWLSQKLPRIGSQSETSSGRDLEEFHSPEIGQCFQNKLLRFNPQIVIVEYISLAYLNTFIPEGLRQQIVLAVDTHDVMHSRCFQFLQTGHDHWIYVDEDQEREALRDFDMIIAIQEEESAEFQRILPEAKIIVARHAVTCQPQSLVKSTGQVKIGYFGSSNASNEAAIKSFVEDIWPRVSKVTGGSCQLVIAGRICEHLSQLEIPNCTIAGPVDEVADFYEQVEIVVNPVNFGTGLKIKNLEALAFGKCLVTTTAGFAGMPEGDKQAFFVVDSVERFVEVLVELVSNTSLRNKVSTAAHDLARQLLNPDIVYRQLVSEFEHAIRRKKVGKNQSE